MQKKKTKRERLLERLRELEIYDDVEEAHIKADELLLKHINDDEITTAFENIHKWYA